MTRRLLVSWLPGETRAAVKEDDRLVELLVLRGDRPALFGNTYLGRVTAIDGGLGAAFVDLGGGRSGFLPRDAADRAALLDGSRVVVRVVREPFDDKGPRLALVEGRAATSLVPDPETGRPPGLLTQGPDRLRSLACREPLAAEIWVDQAESVSRMKAESLAERPDLAARLKWAPQGVRLFEDQGLEDEIDALLTPRVDLPSGGHLLIEPVSSMTPIDVNSGRTGGSLPSLTVNEEAAREIPRQLRLRSIGGLVVVDFLELREPRRQNAIIGTVKAALKSDPVKTRVFGMRVSGLLELTRRRVQPSLQEVLTEPCGLGGAGRAKSPATLGYEALRAAQRAGAGSPGRAVSLRAGARVIDALGGPLKAATAFVEARLGRPLSLERREAFDSADFDVVVGSGA